MSYPLQIREMIARQMAGGKGSRKRSSKKGSKKPSAWNKHVKAVSSKTGLKGTKLFKAASKSYSSKGSRKKTTKKSSRKSKKPSRKGSKKAYSSRGITYGDEEYYDLDDLVTSVGPAEIRKQYQNAENERLLREDAKKVLQYGAQTKAEYNRVKKFLEQDQKRREAERKREEAKERKEMMKERRIKAYENKIDRLSGKYGFNPRSYDRSAISNIRSIRADDADIMESFADAGDRKRGQRRASVSGFFQSPNDVVEEYEADSIRDEIRYLNGLEENGIELSGAQRARLEDLEAQYHGSGLIGGKFRGPPIYEIRTGLKRTPTYFSLAMLNKGKKLTPEQKKHMKDYIKYGKSSVKKGSKKSSKKSTKKGTKKGSKKGSSKKKAPKKKRGGAYDMMYL